jgi:hypothetical protein
MSTGKRSPEEIRASIEESRTALGDSLGRLRDEVTELTDWRARLRRHQAELIVGAAVAGFVLAGGLGGTFRLLTGAKRKNRLS